MRTSYFASPILTLLLIMASFAADEPVSTAQHVAQLNAVTKELTDNEYLLRYKFTKGETLRWKVVHIATTETTIKGNTQTSKSRSASTKAWQVSDVDANGRATFAHLIEDVDMWQKVSDRPEVRYNSKTDKSPPLLYEAVALTVGMPMFVVTVDPSGQIVQRQSIHEQAERAQIGLEQMTVPLPEQAVKVGARWHAPSEIGVRLDDGRVKRIKVRRSYALERVQTGVATITVKTEILTPADDPKVKLNLLQRLNHGTVKFDIDAGRILHKQMDWDETVINFNGADSLMQYLARFTEELLPAGAATSGSNDAATAERLKPTGPSSPSTPPKENESSGSRLQR